MRLSTKGRYGLRVVLELALRGHSTPTAAKEIAKSQEISKKYVHNILDILKSSGLVQSLRGPTGGYFLTRPPLKISAWDVVKVMEGDTELVDCVGEPDICGRSRNCVTREVWQEVGKAIESVLSAVSLKDLAARQRERMGEDLDYHI